MNKHGQKPEKLMLEKGEVEADIPHFTDGVGDEALNRFDRRKKKNKNHSKGKKPNGGPEGNPKPANNANPANQAKPAKKGNQPAPKSDARTGNGGAPAPGVQ